MYPSKSAFHVAAGKFVTMLYRSCDSVCVGAWLPTHIKGSGTVNDWLICSSIVAARKTCAAGTRRRVNKIAVAMRVRRKEYVITVRICRRVKNGSHPGGSWQDVARRSNQDLERRSTRWTGPLLEFLPIRQAVAIRVLIGIRRVVRIQAVSNLPLVPQSIG